MSYIAAPLRSPIPEVVACGIGTSRRPPGPNADVLALATAIMGSRIEADHRDYNRLLGLLREKDMPASLAYFGATDADSQCVVEVVADSNLRAAPVSRIRSRIASLDRKACASVAASIAAFDPGRLGGRGAAGRQRDRAKAGENRNLLADRIARLQSELARRIIS